jgi:hypothetical protein
LWVSAFSAPSAVSPNEPANLDRGGRKTLQALGALASEEWSAVVYREPHVWDVRDLLAHLLSAEQGLLRVAQDVAAGGAGRERWRPCNSARSPMCWWWAVIRCGTCRPCSTCGW